MAETLLYPKKLTNPPLLFINPYATFGEIKTGDSATRKMSLFNLDRVQGDVSIGFNLVSDPDSSPNRVVIGVMMPIGQQQLEGYISLPFQIRSIDSCDVIKYVCHGWADKNADMTSQPDETSESTQELDSVFHIEPIEPIPPTGDAGSGSLFHMYGNELENYGDGSQFASHGSWIVLRYLTRPNPDQIFSQVFSTMFERYASTGTLAVEFIVRVELSPNCATDGFSIGASRF